MAQFEKTNDLSPPSSLPNCQPKEFSVQLQQSSENQFNATISWLPIVTNVEQKPSFYAIRYGPVARQLVREPGTGFESQQPETSLTWALNDDVDRLYFKPPRPLTPSDLFTVQICFFWREEDLAHFNWSLVPRYVLDLAAVQNKEQPRGVIIDPDDQQQQNVLVTVEYPSFPTVPPLYKAIDEPQRPGMVRKSPYLTEYDWLDDWKSMPSWQDVLFGLFMTFMALWTMIYLLKKYCLHPKRHLVKPNTTKQRQQQPMIFVSRAESMKKERQPAAVVSEA